jgi:hypothetical protein
MQMVMFMMEVGKKVKSTDIVYINSIMANNTGVFGRMMKSMKANGSRFQMKLAIVCNMSTEIPKVRQMNLLVLKTQSLKSLSLKNFELHITNLT